MKSAGASPDLTRKRYNRIAFLYDIMEAPMEGLRFASWRQRLTGRIAAPTALEVGVGTGKNLTYYPADVRITAIDLSPRMLVLEHMRPGNAALGFFFDALNPMVVRMMGANINRQTIDNIRTAGWQIQVEENLPSDIIRWIEAVP